MFQQRNDVSLLAVWWSYLFFMSILNSYLHKLPLPPNQPPPRLALKLGIQKNCTKLPKTDNLSSDNFKLYAFQYMSICNETVVYNSV